MRRPDARQPELAEIQLQPAAVSYYEPERAAATIREYDPRPAAGPVIVQPLARDLAAWQGLGYLPGPLFAAAALLGLLAPLRGRWRSRGALEAALFAATPIALLLMPAATVTFDYRYLTPTLPLFGVAGALGATPCSPSYGDARTRRLPRRRPPECR